MAIHVVAAGACGGWHPPSVRGGVAQKADELVKQFASLNGQAEELQGRQETLGALQEKFEREPVCGPFGLCQRHGAIAQTRDETLNAWNRPKRSNGKLSRPPTVRRPPLKAGPAVEALDKKIVWLEQRMVSVLSSERELEEVLKRHESTGEVDQSHSKTLGSRARRIPRPSV